MAVRERQGVGVHRGGARSGGQTLAGLFDPRSNALSMLRLGLAGSVAVDHSMAVGYGHQLAIGSAQLGDFAVDAFFVLSGFLVTRSYLRLNSFRRYAWHRFLRIMPGFWVCLVVSALIFAPIMAMMSGHSAASVFSGDQSAVSYLKKNAFLQMRQFGIAGNPFTAHTPAVMDGSLWTLFYEAICYVLVAGLGLVGVLRRSRWMVAALCGALWLLIALSTAGINPLGSKYLLRLSLLFMLGAAGFLFAERLVISNVLAGASAVVVLAGALLMSDYRAIGAPAFAYLCLWAIVCVPLRQTPKWDLSYGLYVYHWPIVQFLVLAGVTAITIVPYIIVCVALALLAAVVSWNLVEKPALSFKNARWVDQSRARARGRRALGREPDHLEPALTMSDVLLPMTQPHPALTGPHPGAHPGPPAGPQQRPTRPQSVRFQET